MGLALAEAQKQIADGLNGQAPFLVGRPGGTESEGLHFFIRNRLRPSRKKFEKDYPSFFRNLGTFSSGIEFKNSSDLDRFCLEYMKASLSPDLFVYGLFAPGALGLAKLQASLGVPITSLENLEPLRAVNAGLAPWTHKLEGKRVLVIHPFEKSIRSQFERAQDISGVREVLPSFTFMTLKPPVTFAGIRTEKVWSEHFQELKEKVRDNTFDVAVVGAGSYGLPIAHEIKRAGGKAIHLAGTVQLLFGIRGKRWEDRPDYSRWMDDTWVRPLPEEIPPLSMKHEKGSYW